MFKNVATTTKCDWGFREYVKLFTVTRLTLPYKVRCPSSIWVMCSARDMTEQLEHCGTRHQCSPSRGHCLCSPASPNRLQLRHQQFWHKFHSHSFITMECTAISRIVPHHHSVHWPGHFGMLMAAVFKPVVPLLNLYDAIALSQKAIWIFRMVSTWLSPRL